MKKLLELVDDQYPNNGYDHTRIVVRCVLYNNKREICLIHLYGDDIFGHRDYLETPGGGKDGRESLIKALKREVKEEVGAKISDIETIGRVVDYYNLINRQNDNHYFLAKYRGSCETDREGYEKELFKEIVWLPIDKAIEEYQKNATTKIAKLVANREIPILKLVQKEFAKLDRKAKIQ